MKSFLGRLVWGALILGVSLSNGFIRADEKAKGEINRLAPLERFVGEWTVHGKWNTGEELHARTVYEWGVGNKIIKYKSFVKTDKGEYQRYDGVMAWHPKKKSLFIITFSFDGSMTENLVDLKDADTLNIGFVPFQEGEPGRVRQIIQFKDADHYTWQVFLQNDKDWQKIINATWERKTK
jgi:hypothetical protein